MVVVVDYYGFGPQGAGPHRDCSSIQRSVNIHSCRPTFGRAFGMGGSCENAMPNALAPVSVIITDGLWSSPIPCFCFSDSSFSCQILASS